jgi:hypothetical protein
MTEVGGGGAGRSSGWDFPAPRSMAMRFNSSVSNPNRPRSNASAPSASSLGRAARLRPMPALRSRWRIVRNHVGAALGFGQVIEDEHRDRGQAQGLSGEDPTVAGDDPAVCVDQDRVGEAELGDGRGDLGDLAVGVGARVLRVRDQIGDRPGVEVARPHDDDLSGSRDLVSASRWRLEMYYIGCITSGMVQPKKAPLSLRLGARRLSEIDDYAVKLGLTRHAAALAIMDAGIVSKIAVAHPPSSEQAEFNRRASPRPPAAKPVRSRLKGEWKAP